MKDFIKSKECFASFAVALVPSLLFWIFQPSDSVPYAVFVIVFMIAVLLLWLFLMVLLKKSDYNEPYLIKVIEIRDGIYLCRPNKLLSQDVFVSFYIQANNFEKLMGYGTVTNVQTNGIIQITPSDSVGNYEIKDLLSQNPSDVIIKPTVTLSYLSQKSTKRSI